MPSIIYDLANSYFFMRINIEDIHENEIVYYMTTMKHTLVTDNENVITDQDKVLFLSCFTLN